MTVDFAKNSFESCCGVGCEVVELVLFVLLMLFASPMGFPRIGKFLERDNGVGRDRLDAAAANNGVVDAMNPVDPVAGVVKLRCDGCLEWAGRMVILVSRGVIKVTRRILYSVKSD